MILLIREGFTIQSLLRSIETDILPSPPTEPSNRPYQPVPSPGEDGELTVSQYIADQSTSTSTSIGTLGTTLRDAQR